MVVMDSDGILDVDDFLDLEESDRDSKPVTAAAGPVELVGKPLAEIERWAIDQTLRLTAGNRKEAAEMLGVGERTLYRKIKDYGL